MFVLKHIFSSLQSGGVVEPGSACGCFSLSFSTVSADCGRIVSFEVIILTAPWISPTAIFAETRFFRDGGFLFLKVWGSG